MSSWSSCSRVSSRPESGWSSGSRASGSRGSTSRSPRSPRSSSWSGSSTRSPGSPTTRRPAPSPRRTLFGVVVTGPTSSSSARYLVALGLVSVFAVIAKNLVRGRIGRSWMAIRDRDIAAEIIGVRPLRTKLLAFAISSFYCGVAGAGLVFLYLGTAETLAFDISISFLVLFMVIIGGLGSILGSFLGAAFIVLVPIVLANAPNALGLRLPVALQKQIELMVFGGLIIFFLIVEPRGLARLWQISKEKLRLWPFPH